MIPYLIVYNVTILDAQVVATNNPVRHVQELLKILVYKDKYIISANVLKVLSMMENKKIAYPVHIKPSLVQSAKKKVDNVFNVKEI